MATILDTGITRQVYAELPAAWRDLDEDGDLYGYLRLVLDPFGGLVLVAYALNGAGAVRAMLLADGSLVTITGAGLLVENATITAGALDLYLDPPVTQVDPADPGVVLITSGDWRLQDPLTLPEEWVPFVAQLLGVDLSLVPHAARRAWIADPASRLVGSAASVRALARYHCSVVPVIARPSRWEVTVTVPDESILTSAAAFQATLTASEPNGVRITLVTT